MFLEMQSFYLPERILIMCEKHTCSNCIWLKELPFSNEFTCTNEGSEFADCPSDNPESDTCDEWEEVD